MADTPQFKKKEQSGSEEGDSLTSTLPMRQGWFMPLFRLQGCWLTQQRVESIKLVQAQFKPRPDDILLVTYPKSGTTWLKALAFTVVNRSRHLVTEGHPLLGHNPHDLVPYLELPDRNMYPVMELEALPSPRLLCTHVPLTLLPLGTLSLGCRVVYLCREPKDVLVSTWYHVHDVFKCAIGFEKVFESFCEGFSIFGPIWEHYLGYWNQSVREPNNVLFLKYDEMMAQPAKHVKMLAEFLNVPFTSDEESNRVVDEVVRLCSFQNLKNLPVNSHGEADRIGAHQMKNSTFFRNGKVGDWENHLTEEMAHKLDGIIEEKLKGSGLTFSHAVCHT